MPSLQKPDNETSIPSKILEVRGLHKKFGEVEVLKNINVDLDDGDFLVLVGPSGCGKSTLLSCIAGLTETTSGVISIGGDDVTTLDPAQRDIAMVFQSYALFPNMTVAENIGFGLEVRRVPLVERKPLVEKAAALLKIEDLLDRKPAHLSGGQRQRVAMGRALVRDPKLFLFDEPLSNLDAKLRVTMRTEIKRLHKRLGASIIYVTHDQIEAMTLATKIVVMKDGVVQQTGSPREIYNNPVNMFVAGFMGAPSMNLMQVDIVIKNDVAHIAIERENDQPLVLQDDAPPSAVLDRQNGPLVLGIRPESMTDYTAPGKQVRIVDCLLDVVEPAGSDTYAVVKMGGIEAIARLHGEASVKQGERTGIGFNMSRLSYFDPDTGLRL